MKNPTPGIRGVYGVIGMSAVWLVLLVGLLFSNVAHKNFFILLVLGVGASLFLAGLWQLWQRYQKVVHVLGQLADGKLATPLKTRTQNTWMNAVNTLYYKLNEAAEFIKALGTQQGGKELQYLQSTENLGQALLQVEKTLHAYREEERLRRWSAEGLAHFANILRSNTEDLQEFGNQVIRELVKYLGCNQGGFFIEVETEETSYLELLACYAYEKKKYEQKRVAIGQGLVGQCVLEQKPIILADIPQDYITITSGLGETTARHLIIVPLIFQDKTQGVVELASFQKLDQHQLLFLEKAAESIASTLAMLQGTTHTKALLENSQQLTHELRQREEKTQEHLQELAIAQQSMERHQAELEGVFAAMDATLIVAYFDLEGALLVANQNFADLLGYTIEALKSNDAVFFASEQKDPHFWENLSEGHEVTDDFRLLPLAGNEVWLHASFTPLKTTNGHVERI
ncbi:MAG: GAF domain-containing protein, partial [Cyclobacteriaceae bacterium]